MADNTNSLEDSEIQSTEKTIGAFRLIKSEKRIEKRADGTEREYRYVLGPVLIPNRIDLQKDWATPEQIEDGCHRFMSKLMVSDGHNRITKSDEAVFVENYIMPVDVTIGECHIPGGTWMAAARIYNPEMIQKVDSGEYRGFSVEGKANHFERDLPQ